MILKENTTLHTRNVENTTLLTLVGKSYYEAMMICREYNQTHSSQIHLIIEKMNQNHKFVKRIKSPMFIYLHIRCDNEEMSHVFKQILELPYENDKRNATAAYIQTLLQDPENTKKWLITYIS